MNYKWLVTTGSYSSYRVLCVADTKKQAKEIEDKHNNLKSGWFISKATVEQVPAYAADDVPVTVYVVKITQNFDYQGLPVAGTFGLRTFIEWEYDLTDPLYKKDCSWVYRKLSRSATAESILEVFGTSYDDVLATHKRLVQELEDGGPLLKRGSARG